MWLYRGYGGRMEKQMETTIQGLGLRFLGFRGFGLGSGI